MTSLRTMVRMCGVRCWRQAGAILVIGVLACTGAVAQTIAEYEMKAAFVLNIAQFVQWPAEMFRPNDPIVICVLTRHPFGGTLDDAVKGKSIEGRALAIREVPDQDAAAGCHILFVHATHGKRFQAVPGNVKAAILTIGERPGFAHEGGVVNFKWDGARVRFEIKCRRRGTGAIADQFQVVEARSHCREVAAMMKTTYRNLPVTHKLQLIIMVTVVAALVIAGGAVLISDQLTLRAGMRSDLTVPCGNFRLQQHRRAHLRRSEDRA